MLTFCTAGRGKILITLFIDFVYFNFGAYAAAG